MSVVTEGVVVLNGQEFRGTLTAFPQAEGWWASLIVPAESAPAQSNLVGQQVQLQAGDRRATAEVSKYVELAGAARNVQVLLKGEGAGLFA